MFNNKMNIINLFNFIIFKLNFNRVGEKKTEEINSKKKLV